MTAVSRRSESDGSNANPRNVRTSGARTSGVELTGGPPWHGPCGNAAIIPGRVECRGRCVVRFDNEAGKGDHRHESEAESPYRFSTPERLVADFENAIARWNHENRHTRS